MRSDVANNLRVGWDVIENDSFVEAHGRFHDARSARMRFGRGRWRVNCGEKGDFIGSQLCDGKNDAKGKTLREKVAEIFKIKANAFLKV